jgi:hypothetical protein
MKRSELIHQIRFLSMTEAHDVSDPDLNMLIDEGYGVLESKRAWPWAVQTKPYTIQTTGGIEDYALPEFSHILTVMKHDGTLQLRSASPQEYAVRAWEHYGEPQVYTIQDSRIFLSPIPQENCYPYDVIYTKPARWRLLSDKPPFEEQFHSILVDWALHRLWEREEDFRRSDDYRARFEARLMDMEKFYNTRQQDRPLVYGARKIPIRRPMDPAAGSATVLKESS